MAFAAREQGALLEREAPLDALGGALDDARAGRGRLVVIVGDMQTNYRPHFTNSGFYNFPAWDNGVRGGFRAMRRATAADRARPRGKYTILTTIAQRYTTNVGHPGFANAAVDEVYLHFEVAATAQGLAEDLRREGFVVDLLEPEDERDGWVAYATRPTLPATPELLRVRERVAGAAAAHGGEYEGWNVLVAEDEPDPEDVDVDAFR